MGKRLIIYAVLVSVVALVGVVTAQRLFATSCCLDALPSGGAMRYYVVSVSGGSDQPQDPSGMSLSSGVAVIQGDGYETREAAEQAVREMERSLREDPGGPTFEP